MDVLILSILGDVHAAAVAWGLRRIGVDPTVWLLSEYPANGRSSMRLEGGAWRVAFPSDRKSGVGPRQFDVIWNRRRGSPTPYTASHPDDVAFIKRETREYLANALSCLGRPDAIWVNHPDAARKVERKAAQLAVATRVGFCVPDTLMTNDPAEVLRFYEEHRGRVVHKAFMPKMWMSMTSGQRCVSIAATSRVSPTNLARPFSIEACPSIYQEEIAKDHELRITVIGNQVYAAALHSQAFGPTTDWRPELQLRRFPVFRTTIAESLRLQCLELCNALGIRFGAIDLIVGADASVYFLEVNEAGQFLFLEDRDPSLPLLRAMCAYLADPIDAIRHRHLADISFQGFQESPDAQSLLDQARQLEQRSSPSNNAVDHNPAPASH